MKLSDIIKLFINYEPSRFKLWEYVRSFDPIEMSMLIYLLENVIRRPKRKATTLNDRQMFDLLILPICPAIFSNQFNIYYTKWQDFCKKYPSMHLCFLYFCYFDSRNLFNLTSCILDIEYLDVPIRLNRVEFQNENNDIFWKNNKHNDNQSKEYNYNRQTHKLDTSIKQLMDKIRKRNGTTSSVKNLTGELCEFENIFESIIDHNLSTKFYSSILGNLQHDLLHLDNLHVDRNDVKVTSVSFQKVNGGACSSRLKTLLNTSNVYEQSLLSKFLQFYNTITYRDTTNNSNDIYNADPRGFRYFITQKPIRFKSELDIPNEFKQQAYTQPLYNGLHCIIYMSQNETKIYNGYGELIPNIGYNIKGVVNCTFEAIILPLDSNMRARSWRYWSHRIGYAIYIVDVLRYEQTILLNRTFKERLTYIDRIMKKNLMFNRLLYINHKRLLATNSKREKLIKKLQKNSHNISTTNVENITIDDFTSIDYKKLQKDTLNEFNSKVKSSTNDQNHEMMEDKLLKLFTCDSIPLVMSNYRLKIPKPDIINSTGTGTGVGGINSICFLKSIPKSLQNNTENIKSIYSCQKDIYNPIIGIVYRNYKSISIQTYILKFSIEHLYDLYENCMIQVKNDLELNRLKANNIHFSYEMADYYTLVTIYGHCDRFLYICSYDRNIHQYIHVARIPNIYKKNLNITNNLSVPHSDSNSSNLDVVISNQLHYRNQQFIYVCNAQTMCRGIAIIRLYYTKDYTVLGYDTKLTDSRFKIPYKCTFIENLIMNKCN